MSKKKSKSKKVKVPKNYYGLAYELPENDKRRPRYLKQVEKLGFDDTETWSLDTTFVKFLLPRLKRYKEIAAIDLDAHEGYREAIDAMIVGFSHVLSDEYFFCTNKKINDEIQLAFDMLAKWYGALWW